VSRWLNYATLWSAVVAFGLASIAIAQEPQTPSPPASAPVQVIQLPARSVAASGERADPVRDLWNALSTWSWRDLVGWLAEHGVAVLAVIGVVAAILWIGNLLEGRVVALLSRRDQHGEPGEREARARTLVGVLHNALRTTAIVVGLIMVLEELTVPIGPLLGGVAVIGLAVAFGAQSLIKDYFTGFMVLLEQQYVIGDVVQLGNCTGQVERITLRLTVLRDLEGRVHFVPHGQITTVTNLTHGFAQAVFDIPVAYHEDVDRVIEVLLELARELRADEKFSPFITDDPAMLGVDALGDSAVIIKFCLKTLPMKRWDVKRELLRRIKNRFGELGIEIPFPQQAVWARQITTDH